jgi:heterodisulfide reductase subunit B
MSEPLAYYPGCSQTGSAREYDLSTRACCRELGVALAEVPDWTCCGATPAHATDHALAAALAARNLDLAAASGATQITTPCPSCLLALRSAQHRCGNEAFRGRVEALLGRPAAMNLRARSVLQVLLEDVGLTALSGRAKAPLGGLRVAAYYGCLLTRPPELMAFEDPENPMALENLLTALGAQPVPFPLKTECCGASLGVPRKDAVLELSGRILSAAREAGAQALCVACPLCQMNLDLRQAQIEGHLGVKLGLPVLYFTQFLGLALGLSPRELGLHLHTVSTRPLLDALDAQARAGAEEAKA